VKRRTLLAGWLALSEAMGARAQSGTSQTAPAMNRGAAPSSGSPALIGTWRLLEYADLNDKDGKWVCPFGEHPRGYFVYDGTGHVHIQVMKVPPLPRFPEASWIDGEPPTAEHALAAYNAYVAYFGTYSVDAKNHIVTHHVEGSLAPEFTDTDQPRPFSVTGDHLEIGDHQTWRRVLERVR
jgi:hypothetical protein